jgi:ribosome-associated protein
MNSFDDERPSKSELKRQAHEQQALGEALAALPEAALAGTPMPDSLREALAEYRRTRSHEGRRRQMQFVGKLMRQADLEPLREAVAAVRLGGARDALALHEAEAWRARLVENDEALGRWSAAHPKSDLQRLRTLVRNARRDAAAAPGERHGRAWRELFQFIKPWIGKSDE